jgi:hypothetical protein
MHSSCLIYGRALSTAGDWPRALTEELIQKRSNLWNGAGHLVLPSTELPICIHRRDPALRCPSFHVSQIVKTLRFENQINDRLGLSRMMKSGM